MLVKAEQLVTLFHSVGFLLEKGNLIVCEALELGRPQHRNHWHTEMHVDQDKESHVNVTPECQGFSLSGDLGTAWVGNEFAGASCLWPVVTIYSTSYICFPVCLYENTYKHTRVYICVWSKGCLGGAKDTTQQKVLATEHEELHSIPGTHAVEGGNSLLPLSVATCY